MQRQFLFVFNYASKVSFNEPSCCIRFVETTSRNLVSERFVPHSFFDTEDFKYTFVLPHTTVKLFDIIAVTETRITKQVSFLNNLSLNNYSFEFTPTETSAGGTLPYTANHLSYKCCNDLNIYKKNELESTFIEIVNPKKSNIIVGVIYRHPSMDLADFNSNYLNKLLENISKEQKSMFLLGDFNVNLLNYNEHNQTN